MSQKRIRIADVNILILGLSFKEDCLDLRNIKVVDLIDELITYSVNVDLYDPWVSHDKEKLEYGIDLVKKPDNGKCDAIIIVVSRQQFKKMGAKGYML